MEKPGGIESNIHEIGVANQVEWIVFESNTSRSGELPSGNNTRYFLETSIRRQGGLPYLDSSSNKLWLFDVSHLRDERGLDHVGFKQLARSIDLLELSHGTISPQETDLSGANSESSSTHVKRKRVDETEETKMVNSQAALSNSAIEATTSVAESNEDQFNPQYIRASLLNAIRSVCLENLTKTGLYLPVGGGLLCNRYSSKSHSDHRLWSLEGIWHVDGQLLISCSIVHEKCVLAPGGSSTNEEVMLAPFGWVGSTIIVRETSSSSERDNITEEISTGVRWRTYCLHILQQNNIEFGANVRWCVVRIAGSLPQDPPSLIEWPYPLCFSISSSQSGRAHEESRQSKCSTAWKDPLIEAGAWLTDWKSRERTVHEQLKLKPNGVNRNNDYAYEDVPTHLQSRYDEAVDNQILTGIYPTPPDVSKAHTNLNSEGTVANGGPAEYSDPMEIKEEAAGDSTPAIDASIGLENYDSLKNDHFDDMDEEMDGDNGVTEDDFRFFDEPEEIDYPATTAQMDDGVKTNPADTLSKGIEIEVTADAKVFDEPVIMDATMSDVLSPSQDDTLPQETVVQIASSPVVHIYDDLYSDSSEDEVVENMDDKYSSNGKFAALKNEQPSTAKPDMKVENQRKIPIIHQQSGTSPSSESTPSSISSAPDGYPADKRGSLGSDDSMMEESRMWDQVLRTYPSYNMAEAFQQRNKYSNSISTSVSPSMLENQGHGFIQLAQIVADQSIYYMNLLLQIWETARDSLQEKVSDHMRDALLQPFQGARCLTLNECASLKPASASDVHYLPTLLSTTMVRVKRGEAIMDMSFAAIDYWKELGLRPMYDAKNLFAFCLFADTEAYRIGASHFMQVMSDTYRSLNLGVHQAGHADLKSYTGGLVGVPGLDTSDMNHKPYDSLCTSFGKALATINAHKSTIVIYIVRSEDSTTGFKAVCSLFQRIFESYASTFRKTDQPNDLVLQIIPSGLVDSNWSNMLPNIGQHAMLSKIIYDKCPLTDTMRSTYASASAIQLAEPLPPTIDFKLHSDSTSHPLGRSEAFHLAYSYTEGSRWLSVAMTNAFGSKQWNASYHLGQYTDPNPALSSIAREIFEIVNDASNGRRNFNLFLVKTTPWTAIEIDIWKGIVEEAKVPLFLIVYDCNCPMQLQSSVNMLDMNTVENNLLVVPPTPDVSSPDTSSTRLEEHDTMSRLVNPVNQGWWIPSNNIFSREDGHLVTKKVRASGYIVYSTNSVIGLYIQDSTHTVEIITIVETYHALRTLARARHVDESLPWHIAVAERTQSGVEQNLNGIVLA